MSEIQNVVSTTLSCASYLFFQSSHSEIAKRQNLLSAAQDYAISLSSLAEEGALTDTENSVSALKQLFQELDDRLKQRKQGVQVMKKKDEIR